jgi:hypothetical protein
MENIIGIDPSLISTAVVINGKLFNYCRETDATNKSGLSKWFRMCDHLMELRFISYRKFETYSEGEITKLKDYDKISDMIIEDILKTVDPSKPTRVGIEGYSYSSDAGAIIDLVTFSALLRKKLFDYVTHDITVLSPSSLKLESCKLTYPVQDVGKRKPKLEWRNNQGISGGKFLKNDMYLALTENKTINTKWVEHLRELKDEMFEGKTIKKPYEDMNDAYLIYAIMINRQV